MSFFRERKQPHTQETKALGSAVFNFMSNAGVSDFYPVSI